MPSAPFCLQGFNGLGILYIVCVCVCVFVCLFVCVCVPKVSSALPHCLRAVGGGNRSVHYPTAGAQWAARPFPLHCHTAGEQWAVGLLLYTATREGGDFGRGEFRRENFAIKKSGKFSPWRNFCGM